MEMKISDLKPGMRNVDITANVISMEEPREITTKFGRTKVANATLEDDTDQIKLVLWGEDTEKVKEGNKIKIENGYVKEWQGETQLSVGKFGKIETTE